MKDWSVVDDGVDGREVVSSYVQSSYQLIPLSMRDMKSVNCNICSYPESPCDG